VVSALRWMGLFSNDRATIRRGNLLDTLAGRLANLISMKPGERDLVILQHKIVVEWPNGKEEIRTATLEMLGQPNGDSAMAKTVGTTCGIATQLLLDGCPPLSQPGLIAPYTKDVCDPVREKLEEEGITLVENSES